MERITGSQTYPCALRAGSSAGNRGIYRGEATNRPKPLCARMGKDMVMTEEKLMSLAELKPGESAQVADVGGTDSLHRRLLDMGITPGVKVVLLRTAPMGDPLEIHVRGYSLTLRVDDAKKISIRNLCGKGEARA